eukprot:g331.t1
MSLHPDDPQAALAGLAESYGCDVPPGGRWFLRRPGGELLAPTPTEAEDAHTLLDTLANAPADIAIVYGTDGHSRAVRIALEIADTLARPLALAGVPQLLAAARTLVDGEQGARSGEILQNLRPAREASQAAESAVEGWQEDSNDSDWPSSAYILVPEQGLLLFRARLRAPADSQPTASGAPVVAAGSDNDEDASEEHHTWPPAWGTSVSLPWNVAAPRATRAKCERAGSNDMQPMPECRNRALEPEPMRRMRGGTVLDPLVAGWYP